MDPRQELIEISSDEEEQGTSKRVNNSGNKRKITVKVRRNIKRKSVKKYSSVDIWTAEEKTLEDDDCFILPSDPFAEVDLSRPILHSEENDEDDVSVVAERGKVACRDYPHPRDQCAKCPFDKTSHETCCPQCFCFVCDILAPCKHWRGVGGHCNASSSDSKWRAKRMAWRSAQKWTFNTCSKKN